MLAINETTRRGWTTEETTRLTDLWRNNTPNEDIAATLGRSVSSIKSRAAHLGLGYRDLTVSVGTTADGKRYWTPD